MDYCTVPLSCTYHYIENLINFDPVLKIIWVIFCVVLYHTIFIFCLDQDIVSSFSCPAKCRIYIDGNTFRSGGFLTSLTSRLVLKSLLWKLIQWLMIIYSTTWMVPNSQMKLWCIRLSIRRVGMEFTSLQSCHCGRLPIKLTSNGIRASLSASAYFTSGEFLVWDY